MEPGGANDTFKPLPRAWCSTWFHVLPRIRLPTEVAHGNPRRREIRSEFGPLALDQPGVRRRCHARISVTQDPATFDIGIPAASRRPAQESRRSWSRLSPPRGSAAPPAACTARSASFRCRGFPVAVTNIRASAAPRADPAARARRREAASRRRAGYHWHGMGAGPGPPLPNVNHVLRELDVGLRRRQRLVIRSAANAHAAATGRNSSTRWTRQKGRPKSRVTPVTRTVTPSR